MPTVIESAFDHKNDENVLKLRGRVESIMNEIARQVSGPISRTEPGKRIWLKSIKAEVNEAMTMMHGDLTKLTEGSVINAWNLANRKNNRLFDSYLKKTSPVMSSWYQLNTDAMNAFIKRSDSSGFTVSEKVWNITDGFYDQLKLYQGSGITMGKSARDIAKDIRKLLKNPDLDYRPGPGVYRSPMKNALRLARTETNMAYHLSNSERVKQIPFILGIRVVLSGAHPMLDICDSMAGEYPKGFAFMGWHPNCICHTETILASREDFKAWVRHGVPFPRNAFIYTIPDAAKKYILAHSEKLQKSGLPWVKDNLGEELAFPKEPAKVRRTRGHLDELSSDKAIDQIIADRFDYNGEKISFEEAKDIRRAIENYSTSGYQTIRRIQTATKEEFIKEFPKWADDYDDILKQASEIEKYIEASPKFNEPLYRGIDIWKSSSQSLTPDEFVDLFVPGKTIDMRGISSWSSTEVKASKFGRCIFIQKKPVSGASIRHLSLYQKENEVLHSSMTRWRITKVEKIDLPGRYVNVYVEEVVNE